MRLQARYLFALLVLGAPALSAAQPTAFPSAAEFRARIVEGDAAYGLANLGLTELPPYLAEFPEVRYLALTGNRLASLPESVGQLRRLQHIQLVGNEFAAFPEVLLRLDSLQTIEFGFNRLTSLPCEAFVGTALRFVLVAGNPISRKEWERCERLVPGVVELYARPID